MTNLDIQNILKLRWSVYLFGADEGLWPKLNREDVEGFMEFLFPKSKKIAEYNLMINVVRNSKSIKELPPESYNLFKFPEQIEEKILNYLKETVSKEDIIKEHSPIEVITSLAAIATEPIMMSASVGNLDNIGIENIIHILADKYKYSLTNHNGSHPYFE